MEVAPTPEPNTYTLEYEHAQLAIRSLEAQIVILRQELAAWQAKCHSIVMRAYEAGQML